MAQTAGWQVPTDALTIIYLHSIACAALGNYMFLANEKRLTEKDT